MKPQELNRSDDPEFNRKERLEFEPNLLPSDADAAQLLIKVGVCRSDLPFVLSTRPDPERDRDAWRMLDRSYRLLTASMGHPLVGHRGWPAFRGAGLPGAFVYVWAFLAVLPTVRAHHVAVGLSDAESWESLAGLGREVRTGSSGERPGLGSTWGLPLVFSGTSFRLGRLAFDQRPPCKPSHANPDLKPGEASWNIHVPGGGGPIPPAVVTDSMDRALELSTRLSDPARLSAAGPTGTGISTTLLDQLPQHTSLQRGIVSVLRSGRHWHVRTGWARVADPSRRLAAQAMRGIDRERENGAV